ncbi:TonB-dependent receptor plug domain-containing protein [Corynebacterium amycolatum]|uniref:TonB-dependent receptor plug domain-containing protein n=1 Tax=Corynebacterium amycolatum TaxID=43765 RepID=UPI002159C9EE|nr:TonB-dependent receptor plug domain-containing protein [Corynebacterium amycolatum]UVE00622.1 TonB-dependent receptor plug domain-containing protein [Corynebacterium amycolatum]
MQKIEPGEFSITANIGDTLYFSHVEYETYKTVVSVLTELNIVLNAKSTSLENVVVIGYGTQKKRDLTGSVSSVSGKDLESLPVTNVGEALQGRASGVQIVSSGAPGSNVTVRVRGTGTINNSKLSPTSPQQAITSHCRADPGYITHTSHIKRTPRSPGLF